MLEGSRPPAPPNYKEQLIQMLHEGRRGDMVELFFTQAAGMPTEFVTQMRQAPFWAAQEAFAPMLINYATLMGDGDFKLPKERLTNCTVETLVIDGGDNAVDQPCGRCGGRGSAPRAAPHHRWSAAQRCR